jgi:hypothetical protein
MLKIKRYCKHCLCKFKTRDKDQVVCDDCVEEAMEAIR